MKKGKNRGSKRVPKESLLSISKGHHPDYAKGSAPFIFLSNSERSLMKGCRFSRIPEINFLILGLSTFYGYIQMAGQNSEMGGGMMDWGYGIGGWSDPYNLIGDRLDLRNRIFDHVPFQQVRGKIRAYMMGIILNYKIYGSSEN